jgi:hypothetical protein
VGSKNTRISIVAFDGFGVKGMADVPTELSDRDAQTLRELGYVAAIDECAGRLRVMSLVGAIGLLLFVKKALHYFGLGLEDCNQVVLWL